MNITTNTKLPLADVDALLRQAGWTGGELEESRRCDGLTTFVNEYREWEPPERPYDPDFDDPLNPDCSVICFEPSDADPSEGEVSLLQYPFDHPGRSADWPIDSLEELARIVETFRQ